MAVRIAVVGVAALALSGSAFANLPKKPACSDISYALIDSEFRFSPTVTHSEVMPHQIITHQPSLTCFYYTGTSYLKPSKEVTIQYDTGTTKTARALYQYYMREVNRDQNYGPAQSITGIGDSAFVNTGKNGGTVVTFLDGTDVVTIKHGVGPEQAGTPAVIQAIESFAKRVARLA